MTEVLSPNKKQEDAIKEVAKDLNIKIPESGEPLVIRIIALIILVGGLSLASSVFTDIFGARITLGSHFLRFITGLAMITTAYGLIKRQLWAVYLYGIFVSISLIINPTLAIFLLIILAYLIYKRKIFKPGGMDAYMRKIIKIVS